MRLNELELAQLFRQPGGMEFVRFCNETIRATCWAQGVPQSEVSTTLRTDIPDGGVDTRVGIDVPGEKFGYFRTKSVWQFKAANESRLTKGAITEEVNKPYAKKCIKENYAYRICVCASVEDQRKAKLQTWLDQAISKINNAAPPPKILNLFDITNIANSYPAVILQYRPGAFGACIVFDRWAETATKVTNKFVPYRGFDNTREMILSHVDFSTTVQDPVVTVYGQSGVGKTRTVFESLREHQGASSLVLYSDDEDDLQELISNLINDDKLSAVIVADECSLSTRVALSRRLAGHSLRIRCVSIDSGPERQLAAAPQLEIEKPSQGELQRILEINFPQIPRDRIRAYAELSEGFLRIAVDMCGAFDGLIRQAASISPIVPRLHDYYRERLGSEDRMRAVEAVALLKRVKRKGLAPTELDRVCDLTGTKRHEVEEHLAAIKDSPGFVERGELYYRVTPEIIAMIAFEAAWRRWVAGREDAFLTRIPDEIQESFFRRVAEGRDAEVRNTVQKFFRRFADSFPAGGLANLDLVNRLINLVKTDPEQYLPRLRDIVGSANQEELMSVQKQNWIGGSWGPRRQLVWAVEGFAQFADFFTDSEDILYTLARFESEPDIGNNATKTWQRLFRMQLSGTSVPLTARLELLRKRANEVTTREVELVAGALDTILDFHGSRLLGPAVLAGRLVPMDWQPPQDEIPELLVASLTLIEEQTRHPVVAFAQKAKKIFLSDVQNLVRLRWIDIVKPVVSSSGMDEQDRALLAGKLKQWATRSNDMDRARFGDEYQAKLNAWIRDLQPATLRGRMIEAVGTTSMEHYGRETEWQSELKEIASEILRTQNGLESEIDWLTSEEARSAFEFGYALGSIDTAAQHLNFIISGSEKREAGLARGYTAAIALSSLADPAINVVLDRLEERDPVFAFQLALAAGASVHVFDRTIRLIKINSLPAYFLRNFTFWVGTERVSLAQVLTAIRVLIPPAEAGDDHCSDVLMDFLGARLHAQQLHHLLEADSKLVWQALSVYTEHPSNEGFWWAQVLLKAGPDNPKLAIHLACKALTGDSFQMRDAAMNLLAVWAQVYPDEVMNQVGAIMLDPNTGIHFFISKFPIFTAVPLETVTSWLERVGVEGARRIARHLPRPSVSSDGEPMVPELTAWVLSHFESDDVTFREFCAGVHSLQVYVGDIAGQHVREAEGARAFFRHKLRRIREWARVEYAGALGNAERMREWEDEMKP